MSNFLMMFTIMEKSTKVKLQGGTQKNWENYVNKTLLHATKGDLGNSIVIDVNSMIPSYFLLNIGQKKNNQMANELDSYVEVKHTVSVFFGNTISNLALVVFMNQLNQVGNYYEVLYSLQVTQQTRVASIEIALMHVDKMSLIV